MARELGIVLVATLCALTGVVGDLDVVDDEVTSWLPRDLQPLHYGLRIMPILSEHNFTAPGELTFTFRTRSRTHQIVLNIRDLHIDEASVSVQEEDGDDGLWTSLPVRDHSYNADLETYTILLGTEMTPLSPRHRLKLRYVAKVSDNLRGLYRMPSTDSSGNTRWVAATQLGPTNARAVFPCMDEPYHKARFTLSIARSNDFKTVANMPISSTEIMLDKPGWVWDHYQESVPMSTYLVAFAVFDFERYDPGNIAANGDVESNVTFNVWARSSKAYKGWYAQLIGPQILSFYERFFNLPFPLPQQDMVALPELYFEAMENWGLITYRESALLVESSDPLSKHHVAKTVAHELAHQWFGNLVTMKWWNDVWLNEGFATFVSQIGLNQVEPDWHSEDSFVLDTVKKVMEDDAMPASHPVSREVYRTEDIDDIFDAISYKKGAAIIRMMSHFLGDRAFHAGINLYLQRHRYGSASQDDLWAALTEAALKEPAPVLPGLSVKEVMDSWTLQTGFPVVTVTRNYCKGTAQLHQERFLVNADDNPAGQGGDHRWWIPLWVTSSSRRTSLHNLQWMSQQARANLSDLPGSAEWIMINAQRAGFYRVNYDDTNWRLLIEAMRTRSLSELARAVLVDDALALAHAGRLDYVTALDLVQTLHDDPAALPWAAAVPALRELDYLLHGTPAHRHFKVWARHMVEGVYETVATLHNSSNPVLRKHHDRVMHWACDIDLPACVGRAKAEFQIWKSKPVSARPPLLLCAAVKHGDEQDFLILALRFWSTKDVRMLRALSCSQDKGTLRGLLYWIFPSMLGVLPKSEATALFTSISKNPNGYSLALSFLLDNWKQLQTRFVPQLLQVMASSAAKHVKTTSQLQNLTALLKVPTQDVVTRAMQHGHHNVWWIQHQTAHVYDWVKKSSNNLY